VILTGGVADTGGGVDEWCLESMHFVLKPTKMGCITLTHNLQADSGRIAQKDGIMAIHWTGGGTVGEPRKGDWNTATNWSSGNVPQAGDKVFLGGNINSTAYTVTLDTNTPDLESISIGGSGGLVTLDIQSSGVLNVKNTVSLGNASITLEGGEISAYAIDLAQSSSTVSGHGLLYVSNCTGTGTIEATGGKLTVDGTVGSEILLNIEKDSDLKLNGQVGLSTAPGTLSFTGPDGTLDLTGEGRGSSGESTKFYDTVKGFAAGDKIEVAGDPTDKLVFHKGHDVLDVVNSARQVEEVIQLTGNYSAGEFKISYDATTHTDTITICFMAGTLIAAPDGNVAVEALKRGDLVLTTDGRAVPVGWIGRQTVSTVFGDPLRVLPIRIKAGAISENVPSRDLLLSPDHAILVDGARIHAGALVNGTSVVREEDVPQTFTYYHVEVDDHALILAENTPAETFVDNVDRLAFDNWAEHQALYPQGKSITELPYPRAKSHRQVPVNIRVKLSERAQTIGAAVGGAAVA
jgi:hypothetical protein